MTNLKRLEILQFILQFLFGKPSISCALDSNFFIILLSKVTGSGENKYPSDTLIRTNLTFSTEVLILNF